MSNMITLKDFSSLNLSRAQSKEGPEHSEGHQENKTEPKNKMIAINLPTDVLFKIFQFHQPTWELNKNFALYREISKKNKIKALRDEMNAFMPFVKYTADSIRYFMTRKKREMTIPPSPRNSRTYWVCYNLNGAGGSCLQANSLLNSKCAKCGAPNYTQSHLRLKVAPPCKTQCCAKTKAQTRCKNHTFDLVCKRHVNSNPLMYWM